MKKERLTWDQIKEQYPDQWVRLEDVEFDKNNRSTVVSAIVAKAGNVVLQDRKDAAAGLCYNCFVESGKISYIGVVATA